MTNADIRIAQKICLLLLVIGLIMVICANL